MKLLRLLYFLLSLAVADLGWLLARTAHVLPDSSLLWPVLFVVGFPLFIGGAVVSLGWFVSLVWLVIAYAPKRVEIPPGKIKVIGSLLLVLIAFNGVIYYYLWTNPAIYKSQIVFNDPVIAVQDSMSVLRKLCESIEAKDFLSCHVQRRDSTLIFSVPVTRHLESLSVNLGRIDTITTANKGFRYMKKEDVVRLLSVIKFLNRNRIAGIVHDTSLGFWRYPYGIDEYDEGNQWIRHLYIYDTPGDTLSPSFKYYLNIKDRKGQIVLVGNNDVRYRLFR